LKTHFIYFLLTFNTSWGDIENIKGNISNHHLWFRPPNRQTLFRSFHGARKFNNFISFFLNYVAPDFTWLIEMHIILKDILWSPHERNFNNFSVLGRILWFIWISFVNQACIRNMARDLIGEMTWLKSVKFSTQDFLMKEFEFDEKLLTRHLSHVIFPMKPLAIELMKLGVLNKTP
jgi:hypothetical protein